MLGPLRDVNGTFWTLFDWMTVTSLFSFSNFLKFFDYCYVRN